MKYGKITWSGTTPTAVVRTAVSHVTDGYAVVDGYDTTVTGYSDYAANVGKYSDIVLDTVNGGSAASPIPVIAYCVTDVSSGEVSLRIARGNSTAPSTTGAVVTTEGTTPTSATAGVWEHMTAPATYAANDEKTSLVLSALDSGSTSCKLGIGYQSASFATAFLRGEE